MIFKRVLPLILILGFPSTFFSQNLHVESNAASIENEANATTGWIGDATITSDGTDAQSGSFSIRAVSTSANGRILEYYFDAVVGEDYVIRIWAKEGPKGTVPGAPAFAAWAGMAGFSVTEISGTEWAEYVFNVRATTSRPRIRVYTSPSSTSTIAGNTVLIDAVSIVVAGSDTEAPSAVTDLSSSNTTSTGTDLTWSASTDNIGVTNYEVFRDGVSIANTGTTTTFNVTGLSPETSYDFTVFAEDAAGNTSAVSNTETVNTLAAPDTEAPSAITDLSSSNTTSTGTDLVWSASTDNVGVTNYEVFRDGVSIANTGTTTTFNVTGLSPSTSYNFTVFAEDAAGNTSAVSNTETVNTPGVPDTEAPSAVTDLGSSNTTSTGTSLSWSASTDNVGVTNYEVFRDGVSIGSSGTSTTFNVTGLTPSTSYDFTVFAEDLAGNTSTVSNTETVTTSAGGGVVDYTSENSNLTTVDWTARDLFANRNVGIGTTDTQGYRLAVAGNVIAEGVRVELQGNWPDFVFHDQFDLLKLEEIRKYIQEHGHLPNIPSAKQIEEEGIDLGTMNAKLLQKIEELTLYVLSQNDEIKELKEENEKMKDLLKRLERIEKKLDVNGSSH